MTRHLDTVVELQAALRELRAAQQRYAQGPDAVQELVADHTLRKAEIEALEGTVEEAEHARRTNEAAAQDAHQKLAHYQEQIKQVTTQREYGALLREIDAVKARIGEAEEAALEALEKIEEVNASRAELGQTFSELDQRYRGEVEKWEAEKPGVGQQIERLEGRIEALRERLPPPILQRFERLFERYEGEPLAPISEVEASSGGAQIRHCSRCNYRIRPQLVVEIQNRGSLIPCDSCQRILYLATSDG